MQTNGETEPLYDETVAIIIKSRRVLNSLIQRNMRIGYNRVARIFEKTG